MSDAIRQFVSTLPDAASPAVASATATQFVMLCAGYLTYAISATDSGEVCSTIAAPTVHSHPHDSRVAMLLADIESVSGIKLQVDGRVASIDLDGYDAVLGDNHAGAAVVDMDTIVSFESLVCGATLAPGWRNSKRLQFTLGVPAGKMAALKDPTAKTYCWVDCAGVTVQQAVSNYVAVVSNPTTEPVLRLEPRPGSTGKPGEIRFRTQQMTGLVLLNVPRDAPDTADTSVDLAHLHSMLQLCDVAGELKVALGAECAQEAPPPAIIMPNWMLDVFVRLRAMLYGRPHCGGRKVRDV
jgi:hypothetical protein